MNTVITKAYGDTLRKARMNHALTLKVAAKRAYISYNYLCEVENGKKEISSDFLRNLLRSYNVTLVDFYGEVTDYLRENTRAVTESIDSQGDGPSSGSGPKERLANHYCSW